MEVDEEVYVVDATAATAAIDISSDEEDDGDTVVVDPRPIKDVRQKIPYVFARKLKLSARAKRELIELTGTKEKRSQIEKVVESGFQGSDNLESLWGAKGWLTGTIIYHYLEMIAKRSVAYNMHWKVAFLSSYFKLGETVRKMDPKGKDFSVADSKIAEVKEVIKRKNLLQDKNMVVVPIHKGAHWTCYVADLTSKKVTYFDSMGPHKGDKKTRGFYLIRKILEEFATKDEKKWSLETIKFDRPPQTDGSQCGVFVCLFARLMSTNKPITSETVSQEIAEEFRYVMLHEIVHNKLFDADVQQELGYMQLRPE